MRLLFHRPRARAIALVAPLALAAVLLAPGLAAGAETTVPPGAKVDTVHIVLEKGALKFVGPEAVGQGDYLQVINETNPRQVGPHTFSLVTKGSLPKTRPQRRLCFTPNHICMAIAHWHGVKGEGPPTINPVEAGPEGWSTMGNLHKTGDSWFTGNKPEASITQQVTASAGTTIYFMCAIHPWMHGKIAVGPTGS
ncbi:MAG TPA: hypothetical protein VHI77_12025 [Solirubrobacterales bacterium]|nr:hypothetical protein [Solirubrobacterales bacterium]